ncbi:MAG: hypothetical protein JWN70_592 [Planctomycetaceae bacterium]|nr:hypothetical protein [Planctomycetaceae bacterium]
MTGASVSNRSKAGCSKTWWKTSNTATTARAHQERHRNRTAGFCGTFPNGERQDESQLGFTRDVDACLEHKPEVLHDAQHRLDAVTSVICLTFARRDLRDPLTSNAISIPSGHDLRWIGTSAAPKPEIRHETLRFATSYINASFAFPMSSSIAGDECIANQRKSVLPCQAIVPTF